MAKTILVVDDNKDNIRVLKGILEAEDYTIRVAFNGEKALEISKIHPLPDLILLDVMMPEMDGYEVCERLKENPDTAHIPVIFVTAKNDIEDETKGFDLGAVDYITKPVIPEIVLSRVNAHIKLVEAELYEKLVKESIGMLGEAGHYNDTDTGDHIWRMSSYSIILAEAAGIEPEERQKLFFAAAMHDTGKIGIPDNILKKPASLDKEEWTIMKSHSKIGADILTRSEHPTFQMASKIALEHHEKFDGGGYPKGLQGYSISIYARIVAIADVFDALTMKRPYKEPWTIEDAIALIKKESGKHFDPDLVNFFLKDETMKKILKVKEHSEQNTDKKR